MLQSKIDEICYHLENEAQQIVSDINSSKYIVEQTINLFQNNGNSKIKGVLDSLADNNSKAITHCSLFVKETQTKFSQTVVILSEIVNILNLFKNEIIIKSQETKQFLSGDGFYKYLVPEDFRNQYMKSIYWQTILKYDNQLTQTVNKLPYTKTVESVWKSLFGGFVAGFENGAVQKIAAGITSISTLPWFDVVLTKLNKDLKNYGELVNEDEIINDDYNERMFQISCRLNQLRAENGISQLSENDLPDIEAVLLRTVVPYKSVGEQASPIQIFRNIKTNSYTVIFPATVGGITPNTWATQNLNNWGSNYYAINNRSALVDKAKEVLEKKVAEDGRDIKEVSIMTVGFSQGGINAASFAAKYENILNVKQVVTLGSPIANFKIDKANVLAYEQKNQEKDLVPYLDKALAKKKLSNVNSLDQFRVWRTGENPRKKNYQTIKVNNIKTPLIPEDSAESVAPGHDPGNYAFGAKGIKLKHQSTIDQFLGVNGDIEQKTYFIKASGR